MDVLIVSPARDTAAIIFDTPSISLPDSAFPLIWDGQWLLPGAEIGWVGYPAIASELCFFCGRISARIHQTDTSPGRYLIDGVAINGVSGGAVLYLLNENMYVIGVVSQYIANLASGVSKPGLCVAQDVTQFQTLVSRSDSVEEAKDKEPPKAAPGDETTQREER